MESMAIPYFPLECRLDDKFELIEAEFGLQGFGVIVKLFQRIYGMEGYYTPWTNEVALVFAKDVGLGANVVSEIVSAAIRRGLFDPDLFKKYQILTSEGIQRRYFDAVKRRKDLKVKEAYLLIQVAQKSKNADNSAENVNIFDENVCKNQQRKEEKRKEEKRRGEECGSAACNDPSAVQLHSIGGKLGNGVVFLTEEQEEQLLERLGLEAYDYYVDKLAQYIVIKGPVINHYATILKWYEEDTQI